MPELHFHGFRRKTGAKILEVSQFLSSQLKRLSVQKQAEREDVLKRHTAKRDKELLQKIARETVMIGHNAVVLTLKLENAPYILVQSTDPLESAKVIRILKEFPGSLDLVEGATLRRFVPKKT